MIDFSRNHFELLGVPARFRVDQDALERAYRALQEIVHPDRHAGGADADQRLAMQASARVNEAYRALRSPVLRAQHLLALHGIDAADERDTRLAIDFLECQLERREKVSAAAAERDEDALTAMLNDVRVEIRTREDELERLLDREGDFPRARDKVRELTFLAKLAADIDAALAEVDA